MWRVGRWAVSIPLVSYKYRRWRGVSRGRLICHKRLCVEKEKRKKKLVLRQRVNIWVRPLLVFAGLLGGRSADLHRAPGGEGQPRELALGHQEDLHGYHLLPQQMAGERLEISRERKKNWLTLRRFSGSADVREGVCSLPNVCSALARGWKQTPALALDFVST